MTRTKPIVTTFVVLFLITASGGVGTGTVLASHAIVLDETGVTGQSNTASTTNAANETNATNATNTTFVLRLSDAKPSVVASAAENQAVLKSYATTSQAPIRAYAEARKGVSVTNSLWLTNAVLVEVSAPLDATAVADELAALPGVESVHPNYVYVVDIETPTVTNLSAVALADDVTPGVDAISAPSAWETFETRGAGVRVAVLDTGVDASHPDIDLYTTDSADPTYPGGWAEFNALGARVEESTPNDGHGHGTHVSGTVAGGNASGTAIGVAPEATLLVGKVLNDQGSATFFQIVAGMQWAVDADADVISMSLGANGHHPEFIEPVAAAEAAGTVVIAAAGNSGPGQTGSPGNVFGVVSVGAVDDQGTVAGFSGSEAVDTTQAWGDAAPSTWPETYAVPRVSAPGVGVLSSFPGGSYGTASGTSMATPHVAGTVALVLSAAERPLAPAEVHDILATTAEGPGSRVGAGIVNAQLATGLAANQTDTNEPNDDPTTATTLNTTSAYGIVPGPEDSDWFRFESDGTPLSLSFERGGSSTGTLELGIVSATESSFTNSTVEVGPNESFSAPLAVPAGTYLVSVESGADSGSGGYRLGVVPVDTDDDPTEPNDVASEATPLADSVTVEAAIDPAGDVDFYRLDIGEGDGVVVDVRFSHERGDIDVELFDADGEELDRSLSVTDDEQVETVAGSSVPLYVVVTGYRDATGPYTIVANVTPEVLPPDPNEPNDRFREAVAVGPGTYTGTLAPSADRDTFAIDLAPGDELVATLRSGTEFGALDLVGYDTDRRQVATSRSGGGTERVFLFADTAGQHFVRIESRGDGVGSYTLELVVVPDDSEDETESEVGDGTTDNGPMENETTGRLLKPV